MEQDERDSGKPTEAQGLKPCPFCGVALKEPVAVQYPKLGLARMHPGALDDGSCPIAGWGFYDEQLERWNTRPIDDELAEALEACLGELYAPEAGCSCHISPPCNDCVDYASIRDAIDLALAALAKAKAGAA